MHHDILIKVWRIKSSLPSPAPEVFLIFYCLHWTFVKFRFCINRSSKMVFCKVCPCLVMDLLPWIQALIGRQALGGIVGSLSVVLCLCVIPQLRASVQGG